MGTLTIGPTPKTNNPQPLHAQRNRQMKRSSSDAGLPPTPRPLQISAIPVFNPFAIQPPTPPAPLPPTMTTAQRPAIAAWPQPSPAFYTFAANQAYPPRPSGLPVSTAVPHGMRFVSRPPTNNAPLTTPPSSTGLYTPSKLAGKTEAIVKLATPADLSELASTLGRSDNTVTKITLETSNPKELKGMLDAICKSKSAIELVVVYTAPMPQGKGLEASFSGLLDGKAPVKSFKWISKISNATNTIIDQCIFESVLAIKNLERFDFSAPKKFNCVSVFVSDPEKLANSVKNHASLKSLSLNGVNGSWFLNNILKGAAENANFKEICLESIDLKECGEALKLAANNNKNLNSISLRACQLESSTLSNILNCVTFHEALKSLDFSRVKIPNEELRSIGEPIGELLFWNNNIQTLRIKCALSPDNVTHLTSGLSVNTSITFLEMEALKDATNDQLENDGIFNLKAIFRSNQSLQKMVLRLPEYDKSIEAEVLEGVAQHRLTKSLTLENLIELDGVINFLKLNPTLTNLKLKVQSKRFLDNSKSVESVNQLSDMNRPGFTRHS
jgi:hypothetical protein